MKRRKLLKTLLAGSVFGLGGVTAFQWYQQSNIETHQFFKGAFLSEDDQTLLSVFVPVIAASMPDKPDLKTAIYNIDQTISLLPLRTQAELRELLDLLASGFGRLVIAGVWLSWQSSSQDSVHQFLQDWREHTLQLLQQAYVGLHQLITGAIYAEQESWEAIGYPGPLKISL